MDDAHAGGSSAEPRPPRPPVDMGFPIRPVFLFFLALIPCYLAVFWGVEHWRTRQGPWVLDFSTDASGVPALRVLHPTIVPAGVEVRFVDERQSGATNGSVILNRPMQPLPWGRRISEDLTALPGVETLSLFGHEVELAPRVLVVDRKEIAWRSQAVIAPKASEKLPPDRSPEPRRR
ncbi:MAG: hypothetical protein HYR88_01570 [Verrucomicrobia bacterium]|nr:hypothetical protein [Verrucomicrobiota bacterium]MBI3868382.1 hypothetical protein [Verrucomicrobiota bacterium]